jgi:hypothetical protein
MTDLRYVSNASCDGSDPLARSRMEVLERAVGKIVVLGGQVGVTADQMIAMLNSGMSVGELVEYLLSLTGNVA